MSHWPTWFDAAGQPPIDQAISDLYQRLNGEIGARQPVCNQSGSCCRFESYGHRLYVTGLEIARFVLQSQARGLGSATIQVESDRSWPLHVIQASREDACVYQIDGLCSAHEIRPMGCRLFFCDPAAQDWQQAVYESYLTELKVMHKRMAIPYGYMEWRAGLAEAMQVVAT